MAVVAVDLTATAIVTGPVVAVAEGAAAIPRAAVSPPKITAIVPVNLANRAGNFLRFFDELCVARTSARSKQI